MARLNINPTRMELRNLKVRLKTAVRGHKLLKDKSDEMIRQFLVFVKENKRLREQLEAQLKGALGGFMLAGAISGDEVIGEATALPPVSTSLSVSEKNVMSVKVPAFSISETEGEKYPYSFASVTAELDESIGTLGGMLPDLLKLAEVEKTCNMLAVEIEKTRRRVNALEYVMIPQIEETIKYIKMKLDENERGATVRLMKVKSMMEKRES